MSEFEDLSKDLEIFAKSINQIIDRLNAKRKLGHYVEQLNQNHSKLKALAKEIGKTNSLKVAVVGNFNSGKSSFINSLIEEEVCVVGVNPTTSSVTRFSKSETEQIFLMKNGKRDEVISREDFKDLTCHKVLNDESFYEFEYLLPKFPFEDIELFDTPGFNNSKHIDDDMNTMTIAKKTDIILFLMDINKGNLDKGMLEKVNQLVNGHSKKCYLILNHADNKSPQKRDEICKLNQTNHGSLFSEILVYSSKYGEEEKEYFAEKKLQVKNLIYTFREMKFSIYNLRYCERTESALADVTKIISKLGQEVDSYLTELNAKEKRRTQKLKRLENLERKCNGSDFLSPFIEHCYLCICSYIHETHWFSPDLYKWSFNGPAYNIFVRDKLLELLYDPFKNDLDVEYDNLIAEKSIELIRKISRKLSKMRAFEESEEDEILQRMDFYDAIEQILLNETILQILKESINKLKKESSEFQFFEELSEKIKDAKKDVKKLKTTRGTEESTAKSI